jgi:hypothetical protein
MSTDSITATLIYLCIPWAILECASQLHQHYSGRAGSAVLGVRKRLTKSISARERDGRTIWISRSPFHIRIETIRFNAFPEILLKKLNCLSVHKDKRESAVTNGWNGVNDSSSEDADNRSRQNVQGNGRAQHFVDHFYEAGALFGGLALFASILFLICGAFDLIGQISDLGESAKLDTAPSLQKRGLELSETIDRSKSHWAPSLVPLVSSTEKKGRLAKAWATTDQVGPWAADSWRNSAF